MIRRTDGSASGPEEDTVALARRCRVEKGFTDISTMFASNVDTCQYQMTERATLQHCRSVFVLLQSSAAHAFSTSCVHMNGKGTRLGTTQLQYKRQRTSKL